MARTVRLALLAGAFTLLTTVGPVTANDPPSAETLAMLDPIARAQALCGKGAADALRQRLALIRLLSSPAMAAQQIALPSTAGTAALKFPVTTSNDAARSLFLTGMMLNYGFNHDAAIHAFREAQQLDPNCASCFWAEALAHGPNINAAMDAEALAPTLAALGRAQALRDRASPPEQALIDALALRYSKNPAVDRAALDAAYADAMLAVAARFPDQDDIALLAAEAVMDTRPWDYWETDRRTPKGRIGDAVRLVETVLARNPTHPQASHLYIHLMENNIEPQRAETAADRLVATAPPNTGHLIHMPAHIYLRLGRFADSIKSNVIAARADEAYLASSGENPLYRYGYYPHNVHFIVTSAQMAGDMTTAIREAQRLRSVVNDDVAAKFAWVQAVAAAPYLAYAQFASPEQILALPEANPRLLYATGMRHYARAVAYAQRRDRKGFDRELGALRKLRTANKFEDMVGQGMPAPDLLLVAESAVQGRFALARGRYAQAAQFFREAAAAEVRIPYMEPPWWYYPTHQSLGAALYKARRYGEAKQAFQEALARYPANGWALYGLAMSERALGNKVEAAAADAALSRAWLGDRRWLRMERL